MRLEKEIVELLKSLGALRVGFANLKTLAGGPPSADIRYIMPSAKSAISFALPENEEFLKRFLAKEDILSHEKDHLTTTIYSGQISEKVKDFLESKGYKSSGVLGSGVYRRELPDWKINMYPNLSQRYVAVRSGVGSFGWSGNVGMKGYGTAILLGSVLTEAELTPYERASRLYETWVHVNDGGFPGDQFVGGRLRITCGVCALVCTGNREENEENFRILTSSGCMVQNESGEKHVLPPDEAAEHFESFSHEHKSLYC